MRRKERQLTGVNVLIGLKDKWPAKKVASETAEYLRAFQDIFDSGSVSPAILAKLLHTMAKGFKKSRVANKKLISIFLAEHINQVNHCQLIRIMRPINFIMSLWALATMQLTWERLSPAHKSTYLDAFIRSIRRMNSQGISNSLWALATMKLTWEQLPLAHQAACLDALIGNAPDMNSQDISNNLWALATMRLTWEQLPLDHQTACLNALIRNAPDMSPQNISNSLWALSTMKLTWEQLPLTHQAVCLDAFIRNAPEMNTQGISNSLWALANVGLSWERLTPAHKGVCLDAFIRNAPEMNPQEISISLWALAKMGLSWERLPSAHKSACLDALIRNVPEMNPQNISNSLWGLAIMLPPITDEHVVLAVNILLDTLQFVAPECIKISERMSISLSIAYFKPSLCREDIFTFEKETAGLNEVNESLTQSLVYTYLHMMLPDTDIQSEVELASVPADIYLPDHRLIIEVDGPHHQTLRQSLTDQLTNTIRARDGLTVARINITSASFNMEFLDLLVASILKNDFGVLAEIDCLSIHKPTRHHNCTNHPIAPLHSIARPPTLFPVHPLSAAAKEYRPTNTAADTASKAMFPMPPSRSIARPPTLFPAHPLSAAAKEYRPTNTAADTASKAMFPMPPSRSIARPPTLFPAHPLSAAAKEYRPTNTAAAGAGKDTASELATFKV